MKLIVLDGEKQKTPNDIYDYLSQELAFGPYFGRNADALYDFMTPIDDECRPLIVEWRNSSVFKNSYPEEFSRLLSTFRNIARFSGFNEGVFKFNVS
ncbi:barstar family protein [Pectobacterium aroidearum]|uniref:barstar family protein n=1 Tax=Pectobacterium aroidearum TaxID=1201031 RepID=UPI0032EEA817